MDEERTLWTRGENRISVNERWKKEYVRVDRGVASARHPILDEWTQPEKGDVWGTRYMTHIYAHALGLNSEDSTNMHFRSSIITYRG